MKKVYVVGERSTPIDKTEDFPVTSATAFESREGALASIKQQIEIHDVITPLTFRRVYNDGMSHEYYCKWAMKRWNDEYEQYWYITEFEVKP